MKNPKCDLYLKGKCNSEWRKNKVCNLIKCPYNSGGYAMRVKDQINIKSQHKTMDDKEYDEVTEIYKKEKEKNRHFAISLRELDEILLYTFRLGYKVGKEKYEKS
jgi:hypothetical protein